MNCEWIHDIADILRDNSLYDKMGNVCKLETQGMQTWRLFLHTNNKKKINEKKIKNKKGKPSFLGLISLEKDIKFDAVVFNLVVYLFHLRSVPLFCAPTFVYILYINSRLLRNTSTPLSLAQITIFWWRITKIYVFEE